MPSMSFSARRIPICVRDQGEAYRESLLARARELGIEDHVVFLNQFVDQATLLDFISMCDVYVTPYLNEAQMTSGTLAYSFGLGKAGGLDALLARPGTAGRRPRHSGAVRRCAGDRPRNRRSADGRWRASGDAQARLCGQPVDDLGAYRRTLLSRPSRPRGSGHRLGRSPGSTRKSSPGRRARRCPTCRSAISCRCATIPGCSSTRCIRCPIARMAIAWMITPARCCCPAPSVIAANSALPEAVDDPLRRLRAACLEPGHAAISEFHELRSPLARGPAAPKTVTARTLWALGECARSDDQIRRAAAGPQPSSRRAARRRSFSSPRAWAFTLLGPGCLLRDCTPDDLHARRCRGTLLADRLMAHSRGGRDATDWVWFEDVLGL